MRRPPSAGNPAPVGVVLVLLLAGCTGGAASRQAAPENADEGGFLVDGLVVDAEIVPIAAALVVLTPGGLATNTTTSGQFQFGPLPEGHYTIEVTKHGYAPARAEFAVAQSPPERIVVTLIAVASNVPYHITHVFVAYIFCTLTVSGTFAPCFPVNVLTGQNITEDRAEFNFRIPYPGLADLLHEMVWQKQATGSDMSVTIRPPGAPLVIGGVTVIYLATGGGSPLRSWVVAGETNPGATAKFDANESTPYTTILRGRSTNTTANAMSLYLDHRVNNYFTFFYNRPGPRDFTVIPDE